MAIFASLIAALSRFLGRFINMALGWATVLLFGQIPQSRRILLSLITLGSLAWVLVLVGVLVPSVGAFLIAAAPVPPDAEWLVRIAMLVAAIVLPLAVGVGGLFILDPDDRPAGAEAAKAILRGYPYAATLAVVLIFLLFEATFRRLRSMVKRWEAAHVPIIVKPGGYEQVCRDLAEALDAARLELRPQPAPRALVMPARLLAAVGGTGVARLVPDELVMYASKGLEVLIYPSDVSISGRKELLARARAAVATRITFSEAYLTSSKEGQRVEDRLAALGSSRAVQAVSGAVGATTATPGTTTGLPPAATASRATSDAAISSVGSALAALPAIDDELSSMVLPWDEWEVLYRLRLQVERDLRATHDVLAAAKGAHAAPVQGISGSRSASGYDHRPAGRNRLDAVRDGLRRVVSSVTRH